MRSCSARASPSGTPCSGDSGGALTLESPAMLAGVEDDGILVSGKRCVAGAENAFADVAAPEIQDFLDGSEEPPRAPRGGRAVIREAPINDGVMSCESGAWSGSPTFTYTFLEKLDWSDSATGCLDRLRGARGGAGPWNPLRGAGEQRGWNGRRPNAAVAGDRGRACAPTGAAASHSGSGCQHDAIRAAASGPRVVCRHDHCGPGRWSSARQARMRGVSELPRHAHSHSEEHSQGEGSEQDNQTHGEGGNGELLDRG